MTLISEKRQVFNDLCIPWDMEIERKFEKEKTLCDEASRYVLDRICKPYLEYAFEHEAETYAKWLKQKYRKRNISEAVIKRELGEENFDLLLQSNLIVEIPHTRNLYLIKEI